MQLRNNPNMGQKKKKKKGCATIMKLTEVCLSVITATVKQPMAANGKITGLDSPSLFVPHHTHPYVPKPSGGSSSGFREPEENFLVIYV